MAGLLEQARALVSAQRWLDLRAMEPGLLTLTGEDLVRVHGFLCWAYFSTAQSPADWRAARHHGQECLRLATAGSYWRAWSMQALSTIYSNLGRPSETSVYARAFLKEVAKHPELQVGIPFAWQHLGRAARWAQHPDRAIHCYRIAIVGFLATGNEQEAHRTQLHIVWALLKAGRTSDALRECPNAPVPGEEPFWHATRALLATSRGDWELAWEEATIAQQGPWAPYDSFVAAEMCLLLSQVSLRIGARAEAISWTKRATELSSRQDQGLFTRLVLAARAEGGDFFAAVASYGAGGYHPDASLSTGVGG